MSEERADIATRFQPGNRAWEARTKVGRELLFKTPQHLWEACLEYFQWAEDHPLWEAKAMSSGGKVEIVHIPKMRAMTIDGLSNFLDIAALTWREYAKRPDFAVVCARAEAIIREQKFTGASADLLNASIIARDLGLADRTEVTGKDGGPIKSEGTIDISGLSKDQREALASIRLPTD